MLACMGRCGAVDCGIETIPMQGGVETNSIQTVGWRLFQYKEEEEGFGVETNPIHGAAEPITTEGAG